MPGFFIIIHRRYKTMKKPSYIACCLGDNNEYTLAQVFETKEEARLYLHTVAPSRKPFIVKRLRYSELLMKEKVS